MPSTFMTLCNKVLEKFNENQMVEANFDSATGIQAVVKNCVQDSINQINAQEFEWPFNATSKDEFLSTGTEEYNFPTDFNSADWSSFVLHPISNFQHPSPVEHPAINLQYIDRSEYYQMAEPFDIDAGSDGRNKPRFVYSAHGNKYGITPSPDQDYTLTYRYYKTPDPLTAFDSQTTIPSKFDQVIINGATWYMYVWMDNTDMADRMEAKFQMNIKQMVNQLIQKGDNVYTNVVNFGGGRWQGSGYIRLS